MFKYIELKEEISPDLVQLLSLVLPLWWHKEIKK